MIAQQVIYVTSDPPLGAKVAIVTGSVCVAVGIISLIIQIAASKRGHETCENRARLVCMVFTCVGLALVQFGGVFV